MTKPVRIETGIYQLPDGRYKLHATGTDPTTGKIVHRRPIQPAGTTLKEARLALHTLKAEIRNGNAQVNAPIQRLTVRDYSRQWLPSKVDVLAPGTIEKHADVLAYHILPALGDLFCDAITREHVQEWLGDCTRKTKSNGELYSKDTVETWAGTAFAMLRDMTADLRLTHCPTDRVKLPKMRRPPKREKQTLTRSQHGRAMDLCEDVLDRGTEVLVLGFTGIRPGELYGLQWGDLELDEERFTVARSSSKGNHITEGGKTGVGRVVYAHPRVVEALKSWRVTWTRTHRKIPQDTDWVFPTRMLTPRTAGSLRKTWMKLGELLELDFDLSATVMRRTFNTLMVAAQVDRLVLWSQMGHSDEKMTRTYNYVSHERRRENILRVFNGGAEEELCT